MHSYFYKSIFLPSMDLIRGTSIAAKYKFLKSCEYVSRDQLDDIKNRKLQKLISHAYENIPYYRNIMQQNGINPVQVKNHHDLKVFPILTKETIRKIQKSDIVNDKSRIPDRLKSRTGASTGEPLLFYIDRSTRSIERAALYRFYESIGVPLGSHLLSFWGGNIKPKMNDRILNLIKYHLLKLKILDVFNLTNESINRYIEIWKSYKPKLVKGYANALAFIAAYVKDNTISLPKPIAISTTAEILLPSIKKMIESAFKCPVYDQYGCGETGSIAFECEAHRGLHITEEHVILELLKDGNPVPDGEEGDVTITNLDNFVQPFIRYQNGDRAVYDTQSCICGRQHRLIKSIKGRTCDLFKGTSGSILHGEFFTHLLEENKTIEHDSILSFQFHQVDISNINFYYVAPEAICSEHELDIRNIISKYLGDIKLNFIKTNSIPLSKSGKHRFTISDLNLMHQ